MSLFQWSYVHSVSTTYIGCNCCLKCLQKDSFMIWHWNKKVTEHTEKDRNKVEECKFDISKVNICHRRNHRNPIYYALKTTTKCLVGAKKGRHSKVDEAVFCTEECKEKLPFKMSSSVLKAGKIAKFF